VNLTALAPRTAFAVMLLAGTAGAELPAKAASPPRPFVPDTSQATIALDVDGDAWIFETIDFRARLTPLDDDGRQAFLREREVPVDPFVTGPDPSSRFLTYLLEIESHLPGTLVFQPQNCRLITRTKEIRYPVDLPDIQSTFSLLGREMPAAYALVRPALFDGEVILRQGDRVSGLLVYRAIDPRTRSFVVELVVTTPAGQPIVWHAPYRRARSL
jgi:hypothetical protein